MRDRLRQSLYSLVTAVTSACCCAALFAAPVTLNGARFDAPSSCQEAEGALVCKHDGQQLELWVRRAPLGGGLLATDSFMRKMVHFGQEHEAAVGKIMQSTGNDKFTSFSNYGSYSALGAAMPGKGVVTSPTVRFASVLHDDEIWQFIEVVATRTPGIEALSAALQRSVSLPGSKPVVAAKPPADAKQPSDANAIVATYSNARLSFQYPLFLEPVLTEDSASGLNLAFKHKARSTGPNLTISLHIPKEKQTTAAAAIGVRKQTSQGFMLDGSATVDVNKLGPLSGSGYALIGTPDAKKGYSGVESIETAFAAAVGDRLLEVRLTAEQKHAKDLEVVWTLLSSTIKLGR